MDIELRSDIAAARRFVEQKHAGRAGHRARKQDFLRLPVVRRPIGIPVAIVVSL